MRYLSICSGIGSDHVAWSKLGWECVGFAETEWRPASVLERHWPDIPNFGDLTEIQKRDINGPVDLVCGGTPCQSFSVAGNRKGMDDERGNLAFEYVRLVERLKPRWVVWENVPGVLSIDEGRAFGAFVQSLVDVGYSLCWRVFDVQHIRVQHYPRAIPQRRRRVFLVGHLGTDWRPSAAVLLEPGSLSGHSPPRRQAGAENSPTFTSRAGSRSRSQTENEQGLVAHTVLSKHQLSLDATKDNLVAGTVSSKWAKGTGGPSGDECQNLVAMGFNAAQDPACYEGTSGPMEPNITDNAVFQDARSLLLRGDGVTELDQVSHAIKGGEGGTSKVHVLQDGWIVRRLTPLEVERLFGLDGTHTDHLSKSARYMVLGNAIGQNVLHWLGERIQMYEDMIQGKGTPRTLGSDWPAVPDKGRPNSAMEEA